MSVQQAVEARIRANPEDVDAWRVYGDWLLERGDVRGELIHLGHVLSSGALPLEERRRAKARITALEVEHRPAWPSALALPNDEAHEWRHGFLVGVRLRWDEDTLAVLDALVAHPAAALLTKLHLDNNDIAIEGAVALASSEALRNLTALHLEGNDIGPEGARALASSEALRNLTWLGIEGNAIGDEGRAALAALERRGCRVSVMGRGT